MAMTYQISGVPWLAVRVGQALQRWGANAARPIEPGELQARRDRHLAQDAAVQSRRDALTGMYHLLK